MFIVAALLACATPAPTDTTTDTEDTAAPGPVAAVSVGGLVPTVLRLDCDAVQDGAANEIVIPADLAPILKIDQYVMTVSDDGRWTTEAVAPDSSLTPQTTLYGGCITTGVNEHATGIAVIWTLAE